MTDKVQKIREEVERLKRWNDNVRESTRHMTLQEEDFNRGKHSSYLEILNFIDSLQEEPVYTDFTKALAECIHQAQGSVFDPMVHAELWENELVKLAKSKEPVSEDLEDYINEISKQFPEVSFAKLSRIAVRVAKWQKEQFEKNRLAACDRQTEEEAEREQDFVMGIIENEHRQPTFDDAIKYGMRFQKEQIKEALLSEVLPYFMHGGEADEVVAKLDEVLNQKK